MYRYHNEGYYDKIVIVAGCVQTVLYLDFFYLYATKGNFLAILLVFLFSSYSYARQTIDPTNYCRQNLSQKKTYKK